MRPAQYVINLIAWHELINCGVCDGGGGVDGGTSPLAMGVCVCVFAIADNGTAVRLKYQKANKLLEFMYFIYYPSLGWLSHLRKHDSFARN